jgi:hypothetical protein
MLLQLPSSKTQTSFFPPQLNVRGFEVYERFMIQSTGYTGRPHEADEEHSLRVTVTDRVTRRHEKHSFPENLISIEQ